MALPIAMVIMGKSKKCLVGSWWKEFLCSLFLTVVLIVGCQLQAIYLRDGRMYKKIASWWLTVLKKGIKLIKINIHVLSSVS